MNVELEKLIEQVEREIQEEREYQAVRKYIKEQRQIKKEREAYIKKVCFNVFAICAFIILMLLFIPVQGGDATAPVFFVFMAICYLIIGVKCKFNFKGEA